MPHHPVLRASFAMVIVVAFGGPAAAAEGVPLPGRVVDTCATCGTVDNIRRLTKPVAPQRNPLPPITSSPSAGGMGNSVQTVPLVSIDKEGAHRVKPESATRTLWEVTVRYDDGNLASLTFAAEPALKIGDRVRQTENNLELLSQPAR